MGINSKSSKSLSRLENILIIGNGGRENSLAWAIQKNGFVKKLEFLKIDLIVIGPEIPLANGLADFLRKKEFKVFGPNKDGAKLEYW